MNAEMMNPNDKSPDTLLKAIREGDENEKRAALDHLYSMLTLDVRKQLGKQEGRADFQAESIVQSALVAEFARGAIDKCNDDDHLKARLRLAVRNKMLDRKKKRKPSGMPDAATLVAFDPIEQSEGPATRVVRFEEEEADQTRLEELRKSCATAPLTETDLAVLNQYLFEDATWEVIAQSIGSTVGAAKKRMTTKIRPVALTHIFTPVRQAVDGATWACIDNSLIRKIRSKSSPDYLLEKTRSPRDLWATAMEPILRSHYGVKGMGLIVRLIGRIDWS